MAWIKMRADLRDEPEVIRLSEMMGTDEDHTIGKLHKIWSWADNHTTDGKAPGITLGWLDKYLGAGWGKALVEVGWMIIDEAGIEFPNFDKHMGNSARLRAENTIRQRLSRQERDKGATGCSRVIVPQPFKRHVLERDGRRCVYCGDAGSWKYPLGMDHVIPCSRGGRTSVDNIVTCCPTCNNIKNDRTPVEWLGQEKVGEIVAHLSREVRDTFMTEARPEENRGEERRIEENRGEESNARARPVVAKLEKTVVDLWPGETAVRGVAGMEDLAGQFAALGATDETLRRAKGKADKIWSSPGRPEALLRHWGSLALTGEEHKADLLEKKRKAQAQEKAVAEAERKRLEKMAAEAKDNPVTQRMEKLMAPQASANTVDVQGVPA